MLDEGEKKADKKKEEVKQKSKEDEKKIEAAESITTPSGEKKTKTICYCTNSTSLRANGHHYYHTAWTNRIK